MIKILLQSLKILYRFRTYNLINIVGLALGIACFIWIARYIHSEMTVEHFNKNIDRVYLTTTETKSSIGEVYFTSPLSSSASDKYMELFSHPSVKHASTMALLDEDKIFNNEYGYHTRVLATDSNFTHIQKYPIIYGNDNLAQKNTALITTEFAQKVYGKVNVVGETFQYSGGYFVTIVGVIDRLPYKSLFSFDIILSTNLNEFSSLKGINSLFLLEEGSDYQTINKLFNEFSYTHLYRGDIKLQLFPIKEAYFEKYIHSYSFKKGNPWSLLVLTIVGIIVLSVAILNYINIYTVVLNKRSKELGVRKVFGNNHGWLFSQLLTENLLMITLSILLAQSIVAIGSDYLEKNIGLEQIVNTRFDLLLIGALLFALSIAVSIYPFVKYNYTQSIQSIQRVNIKQGGNLVRYFFLTFQYALTIFILTVSFFMGRHVYAMLHADLGYRTKNIIQVDFSTSHYQGMYSSDEEWLKEKNKGIQIKQQIDQALNSSPLFTTWSLADRPNAFEKNIKMKLLPDGVDKEVEVILTDMQWKDLYELTLVAGRWWDESSVFAQYDLIVTESFLQYYGIENFSEASIQTERRLWWSTGVDIDTNPPYRIVGVLKDFRAGYLAKKDLPLCLTYGGDSREMERPGVFTIAFREGRTQEAIEFLSKLHEETIGGEFNYTFVDDEVKAMYQEDKKIATTYILFTCIAIIISMLGLFSMSLFDIQRRYKEIGIRKVNGASIRDIFKLFIRKYTIMLLIAFTVASPLAYFAIARYLSNYAFKISISGWFFVGSFLLTAAVSLLTISYQVIKAGRSNPTDAIKID